MNKQNRNRPAHTDNKLMVAKGERKQGDGNGKNLNKIPAILNSQTLVRRVTFDFPGSKGVRGSAGKGGPAALGTVGF